MLREEGPVAVEKQPHLVISTDSHVGPDSELSHEYCDLKMLVDFDAFTEQMDSGDQEQHLFAARDPEINDRWRDYAENAQPLENLPEGSENCDAVHGRPDSDGAARFGAF